jgi:hypothetical protein
MRLHCPAMFRPGSVLPIVVLSVAASAAAPAAAAPPAAPATAAPAGAGGAATTLVVCAPGYPGNTQQAKPTMDAFAATFARAAGRRPGDLAAVYHESADGCSTRLSLNDAGLALVTLPYFLQERKSMALTPRLQVSIEPGGRETWTLVARRGQVRAAADLDGYEVLGSVGYSTPFVRGPVLGAWGALPLSARIEYAPTPLKALNRAAMGDKVAVVLDNGGIAALPSLPFASELEVVTHSASLPPSLLCTVGDRLAPADATRLVDTLAKMDQSPDGAAALKTLRVKRFEPLDRAAIEAARQAFDRAATGR